MTRYAILACALAIIATPTVAQGPVWAGQYEGKSRTTPWSGEAKITAIGGGSYKVAVAAVGEGGGSGTIEGVARPVGNTLTIRAALIDTPREFCTVTLTRTPSGIKVAQTDNCYSYVGMGASFDGIMRKVK